jgi:hypothetical protein
LTNKRRPPKSLLLSLISVFAALNVLANALPLTPVLGVNGTFFRLGWVLTPLTGVLLGPIAGGVSCMIAGLMELLIGFQVSQPFGVFSPFRAFLSAFLSGSLGRGRWKTALTIHGLLIVSWVLLPSGREAIAVVPFYLLGFFFIVFFRSRMGAYVDSSSWRKIALGIAVVSYCGNIARHLLGNILLVLFADMPSIVFITAIPFTFIEQVSFTAASTILGVALTRTRLRELADLSML